MSVIRQLMDPIDLVFYSYYDSQWGPSTVWLRTFFKITYFQKKENQTGLQQLEGVNDDRNLIFKW